MEINGVAIRDSAAEAFDMWGARLVLTARSRRWTEACAAAVTGFATSVIGCPVEAAVEERLEPDATPDGRPGASVLLFATERTGLEKALVDRVGQCVLTCATAACWDGLPDAPDAHDAGRRVALFADGHEERVDRHGRDTWRVPVTEGDFLVEHALGVRPAVGGGNFLVIAVDREAGLSAAEAAAEAARGPGVALPFPGGISRAASKVGARRHRFLRASTNDPFLPELRDSDESALPDDAASVLEIVVNGLAEPEVRAAMARGVEAACRPGVLAIDAASFGGRLGDRRLPLRELLGADA